MFATSGESVARFCARHGLRKTTFTWWRSQLGGAAPEAAARPASKDVRLVAVDVIGLPDGAGVASRTVELAIDGVHLRVEVGTDVIYVAALVTALRRPPC